MKKFYWIIAIGVIVYIAFRYVPLKGGKILDVTYKAPRY